MTFLSAEWSAEYVYGERRKRQRERERSERERYKVERERERERERKKEMKKNKSKVVVGAVGQRLWFEVCVVFGGKMESYCGWVGERERVWKKR